MLADGLGDAVESTSFFEDVGRRVEVQSKSLSADELALVGLLAS